MCEVPSILETREITIVDRFVGEVHFDDLAIACSIRSTASNLQIFTIACLWFAMVRSSATANSPTKDITPKKIAAKNGFI